METAPLHIIADTREGLPYSFSGYAAIVERGTLESGDYSILGFEDRISIERKTIDDLIGCLMGDNRERFERELGRLRAYDFAAVVCECTLDDLRRGRYRSDMNPKSAIQSVIAFMARYRLPFVFATDRAGGEMVTFSLLQKYARESDSRYRALKRGEKCHSKPLPGAAEALLGHPSASNGAIENQEIKMST